MNMSIPIRKQMALICYVFFALLIPFCFNKTGWYPSTHEKQISRVMPFMRALNEQFGGGKVGPYVFSAHFKPQDPLTPRSQIYTTGKFVVIAPPLCRKKLDLPKWGTSTPPLSQVNPTDLRLEVESLDINNQSILVMTLWTINDEKDLILRILGIVSKDNYCFAGKDEQPEVIYCYFYLPKQDEYCCFAMELESEDIRNNGREYYKKLVHSYTSNFVRLLDEQTTESASAP